MAGSFAKLLEKYKKIYFDADYYLKAKAAAYNAKREGGRGDWTAKNLGVKNAWEDFRTSGAFYQKADGTIGIDPSPYFDVNRYYRDKGGVAKEDPISDYTRFVVSRYDLADPAQTSMPVAPARVGLGKMEINGMLPEAQPYLKTRLADLPKADDGFTRGLQHLGLNWNYLGLTQGNVLYYSFDRTVSWFENAGGGKSEYVSAYGPLDARYHDDCRTVFSMLTDITGITFKETADLGRSNIHFLSGSGKVGRQTWDGVTFFGYPTSCILIDAGGGASDPFVFSTIAHEVGHALGMSHPFDENNGGGTGRPGKDYEQFGDNAFNDKDYTIMSYNPGVFGNAVPVYGPRDVLALRYLYGTDGLNGGEGIVFVNTPTAGDDSLTGTNGGDQASGMSGNDTMRGLGGTDTLYGDAGRDFLDGGAGADKLYGGDGVDTLYGQAGNDLLYGGAGADKLYGGDGVDTLYGQAGNDLLYGGPGADKLYGGDGVDTLYGQAGNDLLYGGAGADKLYGGADRDTLYGQAGNDRLYGADGNDSLAGGIGDDTLCGGAGADTLTGGAGRDAFLFNASLNGKTNVEVVTDFVHGADGINLGESVFAALVPGRVKAANFCANARGAAVDRNDYIIYNTKTGALLYDRDGSGKAAAVQFAVLRNRPKNLAASDFLVVK